jgi:hypothetical protein
MFVLQRFDNEGFRRLHYIKIIGEEFRGVRRIDNEAVYPRTEKRIRCEDGMRLDGSGTGPLRKPGGVGHAFARARASLRRG